MIRLTSLILVAGIAACSSGSHIPVPVGEPDGAIPADTVAVETFDITPYGDEPVEVRLEVEHDVPASLMENRADAGIEIRVDGFRVQVYSTLDQEEAASAEQAVRLFWRETIESADPEDHLPPEMPVYGLFRQPYYRIRVGDFVDRDEADRIALVLGARFEGALVVPDKVIVVK